MSAARKGDRPVVPAETLARWKAAMERLPEIEREAFLLWRVDDLTQRQIGESMGLSMDEVQALLARALAQLTYDLHAEEADAEDKTAPSDRRRTLGMLLSRFAGSALQAWRRWWQG